MSSSRVQEIFDRLADFLRKDGGFGDVIGFGFAAETSAQQSDVADDVFRLDAECQGHGGNDGLRILGGRPDFDFAVAVMGHGGGVVPWAHGARSGV